MNIHEAIDRINNEDLIFEKGIWKVKMPYYLKRIIEERRPRHVYMMIKNHYSDVIPYIMDREPVPLSMIA